MKIINRSDNAYVVRFDKGESWPGVFLDLCRMENIQEAFFYGLGGCIDPEIAYYDLEGKREYIRKTHEGIYEVLNVIGNVAVMDGESKIHCHITLGGKDYTASGGHLISMTIGGTLELRVEKLNGTMERKFDNETGLYITF